MADRVGQQLGNYRLIRLLGQGGFAEVYLGEHIHLSTQAAIKVLYTRLSGNEVEQFRQEARTVARLEHANIVRVLEFGIENTTPFLVMSYAPNGTLRDRHPKGTSVPLSDVVNYVRQVGEALQYAHDEKLIHRDIKPENMLLGRRNEVLLSDFGIALIAQTSRSQEKYDPAGTIAYMAPEQIRGHPHPASDQYSLAVVVYEWLSGQSLFTGTFTEVAAKHVLVLPAPLREKMPTIPPEVEQVVMAALAKDPRQRFGSIRAFVNALGQASQPGPIPPAILQGASTPLDPHTIAARIPSNLSPPPARVDVPFTHYPAEARENISSPSPYTVQPITTNKARHQVSRRAIVVCLVALIGSSATAAALLHFLGGPLTSSSSHMPTATAPIVATTPTTTSAPGAIPTTSSTVAATPTSTLMETPTPGQTPAGPGTILHGDTLDVFVRGTDNRIYVNQLNGGSGWSEVPGNGLTLSAPTVTRYGATLYLFVRGTDNKIYNNLFNSSWSGWSEVPGNGVTPDAPAVTQYANTLYLFVRGTDNRIYVNTFNGSAWSGWSEVPRNGLTLSAPAATRLGNTLYLFVRGTDNRIYVNTFNGSSWSGWGEVPGGGLTPDAPTTTQFANTLYMFVRGTDDKIYVNTFNGSSWSGWGEVPGGGLTSSGPGATQYKNILQLFVRGTDNRIYVNTFNGSTWSGWSEVPGNGLTPSAPATT